MGLRQNVITIENGDAVRKQESRDGDDIQRLLSSGYKM